MYRLADAYTDDVRRLNISNLDDAHNYVKSIPYAADTLHGSLQEIVKRPAVTITEGGDCDDKTILAGAIFNSLKIPWRIKTVSFGSDGEQEHVYAQVYAGGQWLPFDATYPTDRLFAERPHASEIIWRNPHMMTQRNGVTTLEGSSLGLVPVIGAVTSIAGSLGTLLTMLQNLPLVGSLFRGSTQHVPYDVANEKANALGAGYVDLYTKLPADGRQMLYDLARSFYLNYFLATFGSTWWDGIIGQDYLTWNDPKKQFLKDQPTSVFHWLSKPAFYIMVLEDITRVDESLNAWYSEPIKMKVLDPINAYVQTHYGVTADEIVQAGGVANAKGAAGTTGKNLALVGAGVLALAMFARPARAR